LPPRSVLQENENIEFLATMSRFFSTEGFIFAARKDGDKLFCAELLGYGFDAGAILATLDCREGIFRTVGDEKPFTVYRPLTDEPLPPPEYFGFVFD
jgi:hypothetical protein